MKFCFRVDASYDIGSGHVIRCLTLANALVHRGYNCYFICRKHDGNLIEFIRKQNHIVFELDEGGVLEEELPEYLKWLGVSESQDACQTIDILKIYPVECLIVDHYGLSASWESLVRSEVQRIIALDDLANRNHDADVILDCGLKNTKDDYKVLNCRNTAVYLLGPKYALLRPEFATRRMHTMHHTSFSSNKLRILVNLGGVDKENLTEAVLLELCESTKIDFVTIVMGVSAPWKEAVSKRAETLPFPCRVIVGANNMADLMCEHDLAIGAAGSTAWERCCLGLPTIMICMAKNQEDISKSLHELGVAVSIDSLEINKKLLPSVELMNYDMLSKMRESALKVTEGLGVELLLEEILT